MINFFNKYKIIFYFINICLIFIYLFPGSIFGCIFLKNCKVQPQITPDFAFISSNHFYAFFTLSVIGCFTFYKKKQIRYLFIYLSFLSIFLEIFHLFIPERSFQWSDLFGNLLAVVVVILIYNLINKYGIFKK
jgi:VanZ family protein